MLAELLQQSKYTVIFTGAGMSTESGVPDFRSATGLWQGVDPQWLASTKAMKQNTEQFISFYKQRMAALANIKPHRGYEVITKLQERMPLKSIITQNTDGLHTLAGNKNVLTLHGTIREVHCNQCQERYPAQYYLDDMYQCSCGGFLRPSVVLFGESLDSNQMEAAYEEALQADLFIVLGSALVVSPANSFPQLAKQTGAKLVIINQDPTPLDHLADLTINDQKIGDVMGDLVEQLQL